jgi:hypothetical protein
VIGWPAHKKRPPCEIAGWPRFREERPSWA